MVTTREQAAAEARSAALQSDYAPLYAVAGLTDALTEVCKGALVETQERAGESLSKLQRRGAGARRQARVNTQEFRAFVVTLPDQMKNLPEATRARIVGLQQQANELMVEAGNTYGQLAGRGKRAVDDNVATVWNLSGRAERRADSVLADVAEHADPAFERVQETVTRARSAATGRTPTQTMTSSSAAKAAATRKAAAKSAPAKKAAAKSAPAKKAATARKATAKKTSAEK